MDIKVIEEYIQAINSAENHGILNVFGNEVQVTDELFEELLNEKGDLELVTRECSDYPFRANFKRNGIIYYSIHTEEQIKNIFGGNIDECITAK
ncbi:hypothetical protein [Bacillus thuringiensis]|uniref:hypothetical protein n=1 Tax=Bacillus thuringiensis TaxID=1428 RepID=UPI000BEDF4F0|nr:hypothetical protein [Bacillus thuringiensis]PEC29089.1 hypothetical protein CON75_04475 [Bacillus thuringiensis]PFZ19984.1 hypothetical protein COL73_15585 [Bacillus thuringiensis]